MGLFLLQVFLTALHFVLEFTFVKIWLLIRKLLINDLNSLLFIRSLFTFLTKLLMLTITSLHVEHV